MLLATTSKYDNRRQKSKEMNNDEETRKTVNRPIGVFDSGVGGISVLKEFVRHMPGEDFLYYGDSAHAPYGTKSVEEIQELSKRICEHLRGSGAKAIAVACNTATSAAIGVLREIYTDIPVIGIEPALKPAVLIKKDPNIIMMATPLTVKGDKFRHLLAKFEDEAHVYALPCAGLMEFAERGIFDGPELELYLQNLLGKYLENGQIDAIVLGCTHYPFFRPQIRKIAGPDIPVIDGSEGTARELHRQLEKRGWLQPEEHRGSVTFENSDPSKIPLMEQMMKLNID